MLRKNKDTYSYLVSIRKWLFCAISVSICGISCATYKAYVSAQSLDFLELAQNCLFPNWKLTCVQIWFPDGHCFVSIRKWPFINSVFKQNMRSRAVKKWEFQTIKRLSYQAPCFFCHVLLLLLLYKGRVQKKGSSFLPSLLKGALLSPS